MLYNISRSKTKLVIDENDGIKRKKDNNSDKYIYYYVKNNDKISNNDEKRIIELKIPPAWSDVWVSPSPDSKVQAIGYDNKDRKQYIYNKSHITDAEKEKFLRLKSFMKFLPKINFCIKEHSSNNDYDKNKVISTILKIVKNYHLRVGKEIYAKTNRSYGVSSLKKSHFTIKNTSLSTLSFKGKSNQRHFYTIREKDIIEHLMALNKLDGIKMFQYKENNNIYTITDVDINDYIKLNMGPDFTIKDFRTYAANYQFIKALLNETNKRLPKNNAIIKKNIKKAIISTKHLMRHTKSISKKAYIMSFAINMYEDDPNFFIEHKNFDPNLLLMKILSMYEKNIINK